MESNLAKPTELLRSAWATSKAYWKVLAPIAVTPSVIMIIGTLIAMIGRSFSIVAFIVDVVGVVFAIAMAPALIGALSKIDNGQGASIRYWSEYRAGFGFFWIVFGLGILQGLIVLGSYVLFIIPGIIVSVFIGFYLLASILDQKKGFSAFTESFSLVKGRWWKVTGRLLFFALVYIVVAIVVGLVDLLIALVFGGHSPVTAILAALINVALAAFIGPLAIAYVYKLYSSLKATRLADVATGTFKNWLIAFLVIGIVAIILIPILGGFAAFQLLRGVKYNEDAGMYYNTATFNEAMNAYNMRNPYNSTSTIHLQQ